MLRAPLDHPDLREIEALLDRNDVAEAQRRLALLGADPELSDGIAFLTTRVLHALGRLDAAGVAERLRDLLVRAGDFPEAVAFLARAERSGPSMRVPHEASREPEAGVPTSPTTDAAPLPTPAPAAAPPRPADPSMAIDTAAARRASWPPRPRVTPGSMEPPTVRGTPHGTVPQSRETSQPASAQGKSPGPSPKLQHAPPPKPASDPAPLSDPRKPPPPSGLPSIPRAPAIPSFRENRALPSYAPEKHDGDPLRARSVLPRGAGRYSQLPDSSESTHQGRAGGSRKPEMPSERAQRDTIGHTPEHRRSSPEERVAIRSGFPPSGSPSMPTLFELASWIDEGRHDDAVSAISRIGPEATPEHGVLRARALAAAGYVEQALQALAELERTTALEPDVAAASARLYVELGDPPSALRLSQRALSAAPNKPLVRLTYALAAIRSLRRRTDDVLLDHASRALDGLKGTEGPLPAVFQALKACILAATGDGERAISVAQRALGLDPRSPDALAAIAEASARIGRVTDARQAWSRLVEISQSEADALAGLLARLGVPTGQPMSLSDAPGERAALWSGAEILLGKGKRHEAIRMVEDAAHETVRRMSRRSSQTALTAIATVGATFLTTAPVFSSFVPFDASLFSIRRVEAAIDVLYGTERRPRLSSDDAGLVLLLGAYVGETLRLGHDAHWEGRLEELEAARVVVDGRSFYPFRAVAGRLHQGSRAAITSAMNAALGHSAASPWTAHLPSPVSPPVPWAPHPWPRPSQMSEIARSIGASPIGRFCEECAEGPLDGSTTSFLALDTYLDLVAPRGAPARAEDAWTRRVAVLAGSYVGETLRQLVGGDWVFGIDTAEDALAFRLRLSGPVEATPVSHLLERLSGARNSGLIDYAKTLLRRAGRG